MHRKLSILAIIGMIALSGCNALQRAASNPEPEAIATDAPVVLEATPIPPTQASIQSDIALQTHVDTRTGFSFDYPASWFITGENPPPDALIYVITISTSDPNIGGRDGVVGSKVDIVIEPVDASYTLDPARLTTGQGAAQVSDVEQRTLANGQPALFYRQSGGFGDTTVTILETLINGHLLRLAALGDDQERYINIVANSLRQS